MAYATSSVLGVDFNNPSTTALFTLGQHVLGSDGIEAVYVIATGTLATGSLVSIQNQGTAVNPITAYLYAPTGVAGGGALGVVQTLIPQGQYGWAMVKGQNLIIQTSGSLAPGAVVYGLSDTPGAFQAAASSGTLAGVYITTSGSTAGLIYTARGTLTYPRLVNAAATPLG